MRQRRLRWFGHIRRAEGSLLNEVEEMRIVGRRPMGRPKEKWRVCLTEDMNTLRMEEYIAVVEGSDHPSNPTLLGNYGR